MKLTTLLILICLATQGLCTRPLQSLLTPETAKDSTYIRNVIRKETVDKIRHSDPDKSPEEMQQYVDEVNDVHRAHAEKHFRENPPNLKRKIKAASVATAFALTPRALWRGK